MERFTGMGFIRLCSSVHNIEITLLQVQNTEKQTKMIRHLVLGSSGVFPLLVICSSFDVTVGQIL